MIETTKCKIKDLLIKYFHDTYQLPIDIEVSEPKDERFGDISIPGFVVSKQLKKPLVAACEEIENVIQSLDVIDSINRVGGFINIQLKKEMVTRNTLDKVMSPEYGECHVGKDKTIVIDFSSPNIAKPFSIGHLRSTIIGHALANIYEKCGYTVVRMNHLGDWGTQFGKLIVAYRLWGDKKLIEEDPINELQKLYVKFHKEEEQDTQLIDAARKAFLNLEQQNEEHLEIWKWFKEESLKEFKEMYDLLGVTFDYYQGEAFHNDKMEAVVEELEEKSLLEKDSGAYIVRLNDEIPPALIKKTDGSTLYITRDLAAVLYRKKHYHFDKMLYVVGNEQSLHFNQIKIVLEKMGYKWYQALEHINFGLVMQNGKKMSTRKGKTVKLYDVLKEAISMAKKHIDAKNPNLNNKENIAKNVGVSAVIFNDLKNHRIHDIEFNLDQMLKFEGQTGPYLQYTRVRIASILNSVSFHKENKIDIDLFEQPHYYSIIKMINKFESYIIRAKDQNDPSIVAKYALHLASLFNKFYGMEKIIVENTLVCNSNLVLCYSVKKVLDECMYILGMKVINEM